jgi:hypothetical protein
VSSILPVTAATHPPPVAIGGVGGSGTRLIADIVRRLDHYMGDDLNEATDNLWFTLLFKRQELWGGDSAQHEFDRAVRVFRHAMAGDRPLTSAEEEWVRTLAAVDRSQHDAPWLRLRVESLLATGPRRPAGPWGWKEPNTHVFLDRLQSAFPGMKYIHVVRNGLDMAHSRNQNQLRLWGAMFLGRAEYEITPGWSLKYWCRVHQRITALGERMPGRFLWLDYDRFCSAPEEGLRTLVSFLGASVTPPAERSLLALVRVPDSIGRFRAHGLHMFDPDDVEYVGSLGFDTQCP